LSNYIGTHRYFTENWKKITDLYHNHQRTYWRNGTLRYFTESWKKFTELCHNHRRIITDGLRTSRSARMSEAWSVDTFTDGLLGTFTNGSKSLAGFFNLLVRISIHYRHKLPMKFNVADNNKCLSVISPEKLLYKTPPPTIWFIFSLGSSSPFLFSYPFVFSFWKRFYCFGASFKHIKRCVFFFLYLCIFLFVLF